MALTARSGKIAARDILGVLGLDRNQFCWTYIHGQDSERSTAHVILSDRKRNNTQRKGESVIASRHCLSFSSAFFSITNLPEFLLLKNIF